MTHVPAPPDTKKLGVPAQEKYRTWVQTERKSHEAWSHLAMKSPRAAALLHLLVAKMGDKNAVVVPQKLLAKLMGAHERTIQRAVSDLVDGSWIEVVRLNGAGTVCAYVVNDRVAWGQPRDQLVLSTFSASVLVDAADQVAIESKSLRKIPTLFAGEFQLPAGAGEDPPSQPSLEGLEQDLPALRVDRDTGEILNIK